MKGNLSVHWLIKLSHESYLGFHHHPYIKTINRIVDFKPSPIQLEWNTLTLRLLIATNACRVQCWVFLFFPMTTVQTIPVNVVVIFYYRIHNQQATCLTLGCTHDELDFAISSFYIILHASFSFFPLKHSLSLSSACYSIWLYSTDDAGCCGEQNHPATPYIALENMSTGGGGDWLVGGERG